MKYYRLDGRTPVPCDIETWARRFQEDERIVRQETIGEVMVSTVFLGLDHDFTGKGPPLLFETLTFGPFGKVMRRCSTYMQAENQHERVADTVRVYMESVDSLTSDVWARLKVRIHQINPTA